MQPPPSILVVGQVLASVPGLEDWLRQQGCQISRCPDSAQAIRRMPPDGLVVCGTQLLAELARAQRTDRLGWVVTGIAHDFNNLLSSLLGYCELMEGELTQPSLDSTALSVYLREFQQILQRAGSLSGQLMAWNQPQSHGPLSPDALIQAWQGLLQYLAGGCISLELLLQAPDSQVKASPHQLERILFNLCRNARDAMPDGGTIWLETEPVTVPGQSGLYYRLTVRDAGAGIPARALPHIFEPFYTTKEPGQGTGLGLAIVADMAEQMGGWVEVESAPAGGACFMVYLPCCA